MPLRPVSELGLVDLTDLASREPSDPATRRRPPRAPSTRSQSAQGGANKKPRQGQTRARDGSKRSGTTPKRRSNGNSPGASPDRGKRPGSQREALTQRAAASALPREETIGAPAAKIGISVVTGALGIAGGLLLSRAARRR